MLGYFHTLQLAVKLHVQLTARCTCKKNGGAPLTCSNLSLLYRDEDDLLYRLSLLGEF